MKKDEKLLFLIKYLLSEDERYKNQEIPKEYDKQFMLFRALLNIRQAKNISDEFINIQDEFLQEILNEKEITDINALKEIKPNIILWQGDITTLKVDAIVNAANSGMLGCFYPNHNCIDNVIHTYSGVQLRLDCNEIMQNQKKEEETGKAKITKAYNLPAKFILHTVGPIIYDSVTDEKCSLLASSYRECLTLADKNNINSIAFCCISTGEFRFPNDTAAEIAIKTILEYLNNNNTNIKKVVFNVFKDIDRDIYEKLLR